MAKQKNTEPTVEDRALDLPAPNGDIVTVFHTAVDVWKPDPNTKLADCPTSLDVSDEKHRRMLFNAMEQASLELDQTGTIIVDAAHYLIHPVQVLNTETGELEPCLRTVFITPTGQTFATCSEVIANRLSHLLSLYNGKRFDDTVRLKIQEKKARRSKRTYHSLTYALDGE